jgi:hypothetical protein
MASPREIEFSRKRREIAEAVQKIFHEFITEYNLFELQEGWKLDRAVGTHLEGHTVADQEAHFYMEVAKSETEAREKIYVTIADLDWNPVVSIWGRNNPEPACIVITGAVADALPEIRERIAECLSSIFES